MIFTVGDATMFLPPFKCLEACVERGRRQGATSERQEKLHFKFLNGPGIHVVVSCVTMSSPLLLGRGIATAVFTS